MRIASWNINSARLRQGLIRRFLRREQPDLLLLQEIKCREEEFPCQGLAALGYHHIAISGQKGLHGVAILARPQLAAVKRRAIVRPLASGRHKEARHLEVEIASALGTLKVHNFYVPAGGDIPDPSTSEKFAHKMNYMADLAKFFQSQAKSNTLIAGDLNIAPLEHDVWSHRQMLKIVSHTPAEIASLLAVQQAGKFVDAARRFVAPEKKLYSWWSYRARDWQKSDRGRRLDHIWISSGLAPRVQACRILKSLRGWTKPSDHVPVVMDIAL